VTGIIWPVQRLEAHRDGSYTVHGARRSPPCAAHRRNKGRNGPNQEISPRSGALKLLKTGV
jgi:hypothetical protein